MSQNQSHISLDGYKHISTIVEDTKIQMGKVRSGAIKPLFTSLKKETAKIGGYYPGDQVVLAGRTGTGKSSKMVHDLLDFVSFRTINPDYKDKLVILFDSYEMPGWRNMLRLISRQASLEAKALLDYQKRLSEERYNMLLQLADKFKGLPVYISTRPLNVKDWEENKKNIAAKFPYATILNIFDHTRLGLKTQETREEELITNFMLAGMRLKNNHGMINFFLSQMNRSIETGLGRDKLGTSLPISSDIFGSDAVFQCADIVLALHRPGLYKLSEFEGIPTGYDPNNPDSSDYLMIECILKQREGELGNIALKHNLALNQFFDLEINKVDALSAKKNNFNNEEYGALL